MKKEQEIIDKNQAIETIKPIFEKYNSFSKDHGILKSELSEEINEENKKQFYIPEGFAHGFLVLSETAEFCYKCTDFYHPGDEGGLAWNDPEIGIEWPQVKGEYKGTSKADGYTLEDGTPLILSEKDQLWTGISRHQS